MSNTVTVTTERDSRRHVGGALAVWRDVPHLPGNQHKRPYDQGVVAPSHDDTALVQRIHVEREHHLTKNDRREAKRLVTAHGDCLLLLLGRLDDGEEIEQAAVALCRNDDISVVRSDALRVGASPRHGNVGIVAT